MLLAAALEEIVEACQGARVERVYQPRGDTLVLALYHPARGERRVLIRCHATFGRLQLTEVSLANPSRPPDFCMLLRKHLEGRRLLAAEQQGLDRIAYLVFGRPADRTDSAAAGDGDRRRLVIELTGPRANAILTDSQGQMLG
ncbi:MAG TPA: NFACT family protein, partial [Bacillota bacterium]